MIPKFITYKTLPPELLVIKDKAFAHSVFTPEAQAMDDLGEYTALYFDNEFIGAVNTIYNQKPIELWSMNEIVIDEPYAFFCRGFIGDGVRMGLGAKILVLLTTHINLTQSSSFVAVRDSYKGIIRELSKGENHLYKRFNSVHQNSKIELNLIKYSKDKDVINERKAELISYIQQAIS